MNKKILLINGHPHPNSLSKSLIDAYEKGAQKGEHEIRRIDLYRLSFNLNLEFGYKKVTPLEPDLIQAQKDLLWCNHLVLAYPLWWGSLPALLKGFFDRVFLPGFAFKYHDSDPFWDKLLKGRSARMIVTSDSPFLYNLIFNFYAPYACVKKTILQFSGFNPVRLTPIGQVKYLSSIQIEKQLKKIENLGFNGK
ncbi:MAG: NADPH:quinone reductase [Bdellovibrionaceae bacterium]|nr:NADPH:quinone reductase [Pseudobdellovibrionaceae bacterium]